MAQPSYFGEAFKNFYKMWQENILCDVTISIGATNIASHKLILVASSGYFRNFLIQQTHTRICIDHPSCSNPNTLKTIITYLYTGCLAISVMNLQELLSACEYLQIASAVDLCKDFSCGDSDIHLTDECPDPPQTISMDNSQKNFALASEQSMEIHHSLKTISSTNNLNSEPQYTTDEPEHSTIQRKHDDEITRLNFEEHKIAATAENESGECVRKMKVKKHSCQDRTMKKNQRQGNGVKSDEKEIKCESKTGIMTRLRKRSVQQSVDGTALTASFEEHPSQADSSHESLITGEDDQNSKTEGLKCSICDRFVSNLRMHIRECRKNRKSDYGHKKCRICQEMFSSPEELKSHNKAVHDPRARRRCTVCGHGFRSELLAASHMHSKHQVPFDDKKFKIYSCKICDYVTVEERRLISHVAGIHSSHRGFTCDICGKGFKQQSTLIVHRKIHSNAKPYACPECEKRFTQSGGRVRHMRDQHRKESNILCHLCPFVCSEKYHLIRHLYKEHDIPLPDDFVRYQCDFCPYLTFSKEACTAHVNAHSGIKQHECEVCQKRFTSKNALRSHMFCHQERQHKCTYPNCSYASSHKNCLKQHILLKHEEIGRKPFCCIMCKYKTALKGNLDKHMKRIHRMESKRKTAKLSLINQEEAITTRESDAISANQTVEHEIVLQEVTSYEGEETHGITIITMDTLGRIMNAELNSENTTCNIVLQTHVSDGLSSNACITNNIE